MQLDLGTSSLSLLASLLLPLPDCDVIHTDSLDAWLIDKELVSLNFDLVHLQSTKVPNLHITHTIPPNLNQVARATHSFQTQVQVLLLFLFMIASLNL